MLNQEKWKKVQEQKDSIIILQDEKYERWKELQEMNRMENQRTSISREVNNSISHKPNLLIAIAFVAIAFTVIPFLPIVLGIVFGHWLSKQSDKKKRG
tara:strand:- start:615 stop:908 length:294 start_codon:yes stop_codon:yes gene_type:complete